MGVQLIHVRGTGSLSFVRKSFPVRTQALMCTIEVVQCLSSALRNNKLFIVKIEQNDFKVLFLIIADATRLCCVFF